MVAVLALVRCDQSVPTPIPFGMRTGPKVTDFSGSLSLSVGVDVPVTRQLCLTDETKHPKNDESGAIDFEPHTFVDWVSIYQSHGEGLPVMSDGCFVRFDADGHHECTTLKKLRIDGSHESAVFVRCDGSTVWFEGNVSKFGRTDNVFGYTWGQCLVRINALLSTLGLPPFSAGVRGEFGKDCKPGWTGARITRLDVTRNYATGSRDDAHHFMRWLSGQQASRLKTGTHGTGETVDFGRGSRFAYSKAYLKGVELFKHVTKKAMGARPHLCKPISPYLSELASWAVEIGLVRFETTYKSTFLIDHNLQYLGGFDMNRLLSDFESRNEILFRASADVDELTQLDPKLLAVYRMWQAGDDLTAKYSRATLYRYRAKLLPYGVDIAIKSNVIQFQPKTRVIKLGACPIPHFYELPSPSQIRLAA